MGIENHPCLAFLLSNYSGLSLDQTSQCRASTKMWHTDSSIYKVVTWEECKIHNIFLANKFIYKTLLGPTSV